MVLHECIFDYYDSLPASKTTKKLRRKKSRGGISKSRRANKNATPPCPDDSVRMSIWRKASRLFVSAISSRKHPFDEIESSTEYSSSELEATFGRDRRQGFRTTTSSINISSSRKSKSLGLRSDDSREFYSPKTWYYSSSHVMINQAREQRGIPKLMRNITLDAKAREIATASAQIGRCESIGPASYQGHVVQGRSIRAIHKRILNAKDCRSRKTILGADFKEFGIATCKGDNGILYLCQLFDTTTRAES